MKKNTNNIFSEPYFYIFRSINGNKQKIKKKKQKKNAKGVSTIRSKRVLDMFVSQYLLGWLSGELTRFPRHLDLN